MRTTIYRTALVMGLVIAMFLLASCEEMTEKPAGPPKKPTAEPLYRNADLSAIKERWEVLAAQGGGRAGAHIQSRAAATADSSTTDLFPDDAIGDARTYGACDVFDLDLRGHPPITVLDCVDRTEQKSGHYHVAAACFEIPSDYSGPEAHLPGKVVYARAGERDRSVCRVEHESGGCTEEYHEVHGWYLPVAVEIDGTTHQFTVHSKARYRMVLYRWDAAQYNSIVDRVAEGSGNLTFSIHHDGHVDTGTAALASNDVAAASEHTRRCNRLG